jgi:hypothetical protein
MPRAATACEKTDAILSESFSSVEHHTHSRPLFGLAWPGDKTVTKRLDL